MDCSQYSKSELIEMIMSLKEKMEVKDLPPRYQHLRIIRNKPRSVEITDIETNDKIVYPSVYKASQALHTNPRLVTFYDGRVFKDGKHFIKVLVSK